MYIRRKLIRRLVEDLLERNGIAEPGVPVAEIAEAEGADVRYQAAEDSLSGFLLQGPTVPNGVRAIIGVNEDHHPNRQRFSIAHELGHLLLHSVETLHVDRNEVFRVQRRDEESAKGTNLEEREANAFAAELLMPESFLMRDLENRQVLDDDDVEVLAKKYKVSQKALVLRLAKLGYQTE